MFWALTRKVPKLVCGAVLSQHVAVTGLWQNERVGTVRKWFLIELNVSTPWTRPP